MQQLEVLPHLFRTESRKIVSVLCKLFGMEHIEEAEDIVSDTFLLASETWGLKGIPENPQAWLYTVAKNKAKNLCKRNALFSGKISKEIAYQEDNAYQMQIDLSEKNINDSQLQMMFAICNPAIPQEAQIGLCLKILCGFGIEEIADAFLTNYENIKKRLTRARATLKEIEFKPVPPTGGEIDSRLKTVVTTLYLLYNQGYFSATKNSILRKDFCLEAMRLTYLLIENEATNKTYVNALLALMCFQSSRFEARTSSSGDLVLYDDQDKALWNEELIARGNYYLTQAAKGSEITKYHLEAAIAYWHTHSGDEAIKWEHILQLYNQLLQIDYSPVAALNRTYALFKTGEKVKAIKEAENLNLTTYHLYYSLLGTLYSGIDNLQARENLSKALVLARTDQDRNVILTKLNALPD